MKRILLMLAVVAIGMSAAGRKVTLRSSDIARGKLGNTQTWTEVVVKGNLDVALKIDKENFPNLKRLVYDGDVNIVEGRSFEGCPALETVEFRGLVGYIKPWCFFACPELRTVTFSGPIFSAYRPCLYNCPKAEKIVLNGLSVRMVFDENRDCPNFKGYEINGAVIISFFEEVLPETGDEELLAKKAKLMPDVRKLNEFIKRSLACENGKLLFKETDLISGGRQFPHVLELYGISELMAEWKKGTKFDDPEMQLAKLELLKKTPPYTRGGEKVAFSYAPPSDSLLTETRNRFNLDSIAGDGDELSRMKNLLHFVHENIRHDGSARYLKDIPWNFRALYDAQQTKNPGFNCRMMALMLAEVLMAEGIPARYLTCIPKFSDGDSHVITVAWSRDLGKWVWVDPTFDAWVTDENGVMLGPAEVRSRLIADEPLLLNDYANWNHQSKQTVEHYLKEYMAKNLYIMGCNTVNRAEPEGFIYSTPQPAATNDNHIYLVPEGMHYGSRMTTDEEVFWAAPEGL
ncbi:MAG: leucine-rich repeat protein [Bacteroidaceae bacterium]|nr:leucine-rich repeat protein [Bacteroidaceae bacterium]